jgi:hypothetical protein
MRKWVPIISVLVIIIALVYWLSPGKVEIHQKLTIPVNPRAFKRQIIDEYKWQWWPGTRSRSNGATLSFEYNGNRYRVLEKKLTSLVIQVAKAKDSLLTELVFIPIQNDSVLVNWVGAQKTTANPIDRIQKSLWIKHVDSDLQSICEKMRSFYSNEDNLYGFHLENSVVADSNYLFTSFSSKAYPSAASIYGKIERLQGYIRANNAQATGYPMLNVYRGDDSGYFAKVALPVDKQLKNSGDIQYRWMLKGGNILVTEVVGGPHKIEAAFNEMQNYLQDHERVAPAIPFQSLITDRTKEPDTSKWITKLYWPMM